MPFWNCLSNSNYDINTVQVYNLPPFYFEVLKQWQMTKDSIRSDFSLTYEEIIWNNGKIFINGKPVF